MPHPQTSLPQSLIRDIQRWTHFYGRLKLVLKRSRYYLESAVPEIIQKLLSDDVIASCSAVRVSVVEDAAVRAVAVARGEIRQGEVETQPMLSRDELIIPGTKGARRAARMAKGLDPEGKDEVDVAAPALVCSTADERDGEDHIQWFEIDGTNMERVKRQCQIIGLPVLEEYDFHANTINLNLDIDLKPMTVIRSYQETALSKMLNNG
ncbi:hypothetical protein QFC20_005724 [Naganishia adeliensis]|uniref:Uncharacterized protein n=1 Tax=Naganishia adeliensis TaxID=92952 RepID=A0ACC2VL74_9TREE|nr:hypothetical protein QFC20_005724 [Naganishia adeliensis]